MRRPLYLASLLVALGAVCCFATGGLKSKAVYDFSKGCDTYHSSLSLPDGFVQNSQDVFFDAQAPVSKRKGYTTVFSTNTGAYQAEWVYTDPSNTTWIIVRSSGQITANNLAGTSVKVATTSANDLVGETNSQGNAYFVDPTQGVYYWNGASTTYVANSPKGSLIASFHLRIWVAGAAVPNGNQLYGSAYGDGTKWTIGLNPNDPVQLTVGLQDNFDNITAIYPFLDTLYTTKHYSIYALYGFDQTSFQISFITSECGCIDQQSIQTFNHGLDFVSMRGVEFFDGYTCTKISEPIKNKVDPAILSQGGVNTLSWVQSLTPDWLSGTFNTPNSLSTAINPPALVLSTGTSTDNFSQGTLTNTSLSNGVVSLAIDHTNLLNNSFESGNVNNWNLTNGTQQTAAPGANNCTIHAFDGSQFIEYSGPGQYSIQASLVSCQTGATLLTNNVSIDNQCNYHLESFGDSSFTGRSVSLHFTDTTNNVPIINSQCFVYNGDSIQYEQASVCGNVSCSINWISAIDFVSNGRSDISFGTYLSPTYDTGFNAPVVIQTATVTANSFLPSVVLQNAPSASGPFTDINTGVNFSGQTSRYLRYISSFTAGSTDDVLSTLSAESLQWEASSGVFVSQVHQVSPISSFGNFATTTDLTKGGNIAYSICTAATSNMNGEVCTVQVPNAQITASTNSFIQVIATFTVTAATNTPTLDLFSVQWYSGNRSPGMASTVWHGRYWLSLSTNPVDNFNDAILVLDDKGAWAPMNIPAGGLIQSKGNLYIADSHPTGNDYVYGNGYRDNGAPINAFIVTKDYPESDLNTDDYYESLYVSEDNLGNFNTTISYAMDRNLASAFNLSSINQSEYVNNAAIKVPFVFGNQDFGKCISLTFTEADLDSPWNFYGFTLYYHDRVVQ